MASITAGNELYLYRLLMQEIGPGRQVMLARIEEVLLEDDIWPCDLGCANTREVLENLSGFVRLTVFKKGRIYATLSPNPTWDEALLQAKKAEKEPAQKGANKGGARSWKRKRTQKSPRPAKPRPKNRPVPKKNKHDEEVPVAEKTQDTPTPAEPPRADAAPRAEERMPAPSPTEGEKPAQDAAPPEAPAAEPEPETEAPAAEPEPEPEPEAPATLAPPVPEPTPHRITLTVTYDPGDEVFEPELAPEPTLKQEPAPPAPSETPSPTSQLRLPQSFSNEVAIRNEELSALYQMLPLSVDPLALLDEDWRIARSTNAFVQEAGIVTFPLRYLKEAEGASVCVSMRRTKANASHKRWLVTSLDHVENVGFEGLPLSGTEAMRALAQFAMLGPWDELVGQLARATQGARPTPTAAELRDYLCVTFCRIQHEHKFATYRNGAEGALNTGLLDAHGKSIYMCFDAREGDMPWAFRGFFTEDEAAFEGDAPLPAAYLATLADIALSPDVPVRIGTELRRAHGGAAFEEAVEETLRRARRDYRLCTPVYDPSANELHLLAPVRTEQGTEALVLCPCEQGFVARALLPLERAATYARVVSFDLPAWLRSSEPTA